MSVQELQLEALLKAGIFRSRGEAIEEAVRTLFTTRPQLRVEAAIQLFREGEVTLGRAAEIAGLTRWEFDMLLAGRGIDRVVECDSAEELESQVQTLLAEA